MNKGFFRAAACVPSVNVADCEGNAEAIIKLLEHMSLLDVELAVFPELCITAYTCGDLFHDRQLLAGALKAVKRIVVASRDRFATNAVIGAPLVIDGVLYNCAILIGNGEVHAIVPKTFLPNYNEFYEKRWWQSAPDDNRFISFLDNPKPVCFGTKQMARINGALVGIEICEDLWAPIPPSCKMTMAGAQVLANLSASDDLIGKYNYLLSLIAQQSARCISGYVYSGAGYGESSTDLVFDGKAIIAENGSILSRNKRWQCGDQYAISDIDIDAIEHDRIRNGTFSDCARKNVEEAYHIVNVPGIGESDLPSRQLMRKVNPLPFVPSNAADMKERCSEIINIQAAGLVKRLDFVKCKTLVIGISGGLDSTLALLVAVKAFDRLGLDRKGILGITMPGFGTTARTKNNALTLMEELGVASREIPIGQAVTQHFKDIGQDPENHDVTYENSQARERTQILMDVANKENGLVLGTGDLSELALGWATYNGDHMSMYAVNASIPKTLVRHLVWYFADEPEYESCRVTLLDVIGTPISPELIPADKDDKIVQKTEDLVGPYELHDFFLYYVLRYGFRPTRIYMLAQKAFDGKFECETIKKWLKVFYKRFFQQQFKRSCMPDGPKVGSVCLSPRGDWRMPSDACSAMWLKEVEEI